jgi:hypothetical protein
MGLLKYMRALFGVAVPPPPGPRRLDGRSATLLAASLKFLPDEEPGWITMKEARTLFRRGTTHMSSARWTRPAKRIWRRLRRHREGFSSSSCLLRAGFTSCARRAAKLSR